MRLPGSSKTTYVRAGTYPISQESGGRLLLEAIIDDTQRYLYYPPDGVNSAVIVGDAQPGDFLNPPPLPWTHALIHIFGADGVEINGLRLTNYRLSGVIVEATPTSDCDGNKILNNVIENSYSPELSTHETWNNGGIAVQGGITRNTEVAHNVIRNSTGYGIWVGKGFRTPSTDTITGTLITDNVILDVMKQTVDGGAIYVYSNFSHAPQPNTEITVRNNFIRDYGRHNSNYPGFDQGPHLDGPNHPDLIEYGIYLDGCAQNVAVQGNVVAGTGTMPIFAQSGSRNLISGNLVDVGAYGRAPFFGAGRPDPMCAEPPNSNRFVENVIIGSYPVDYSHYRDSSGAFIDGWGQSLDISRNWYFNYSFGWMKTWGSLHADTFPLYGDPKLTIPANTWAYAVASGSPVTTYLSQMVGGWGPPGFQIPTSGAEPPSPRPTGLIQAEAYEVGQGLITGTGGTVIGSCDTGDYAKYKDVDLGAGVTRFLARANVPAGGVMRIRKNATNGPILGSMSLSQTNVMQEYVVPLDVTQAKGRMDIFLTFEGSGVGNFDYFRFFTERTTTRQAESYSAAHPGISKVPPMIGHCDGTRWVRFNQVDLGAGMSWFFAYANVPGPGGGTVIIRKDSLSGTVLGTLSLPTHSEQDQFYSAPLNFAAAQGVRDIYLVFGPDQWASGVGNFDYFQFVH